MASQQEAAERWVGVALGKTEGRLIESASNLPVRGDHIFSFGSHFEVARLLRDKKGQPRLWLLNGDRFSVSTARHQNTVRSAIDWLGREIPRVIIPHSALGSAGIDFDSIELLDLTDDGHERVEVVKHEFPEGAVWKTHTITDKYAKYGYLDADGNPWVDRPQPEIRDLWRLPYNSIQRRLRYKIEELDRKQRGYHYGEIEPAITHDEQWLHVSSRDKWNRWDVSIADDGTTTYRRSYYRHWLGESLIRADVVWTERETCRVCAGTGKSDRDVTTTNRWGDEITYKGSCLSCLGSGGHSRQRRRKAKFLSGFDANESRPSYFFCELPKTAATTIPDAYAALKPESVRLAEQMGLAVRRQGDIFAVPVTYTKRELSKMGAQYVKGGNLLSTNHVGSEVATLPDGTLLVRGALRHEPQWRRPDHRRVSLGKTWHVIQKNTVPISA